MDTQFDKADRLQIKSQDSTPKRVVEIIQKTIDGFPYTPIVAAAQPTDGIIQLDEPDVDNYIARYQGFQGTRGKFVPASGAATRMFKKLYEYLEKRTAKSSPFAAPLSEYPFATMLGIEFLRRGTKLVDLIDKGEYEPIINELLHGHALGYAKMPKLTIPFHKQPDGTLRTPLEEHIAEAALYAKNPDGSVDIHFTISPDHETLVSSLFNRIKPIAEKQFGIAIRAKWTNQLKATDTVALTEQGKLYRDKDNRLLFRPAGHGALLANLQDTDQEIIFIKNVDNVAPDHLKGDTIRYKKALAGLLLHLREQIYQNLQLIEEKKTDDELIEQMLEFCRKKLYIRPPAAMQNLPKRAKLAYIKEKLDRPIRICGVVKNTGEPGGGPFWVRERDGSETLQIVETAQMDLKDKRINEIVRRAAYFNPVDLVCCFRKPNGEKYKLQQFVNHSTAFVVKKNVKGTNILSMELPGLWNGSMADWTTLFVEVPPITFTPVKEVDDLTRPEHLLPS